MTRVRPRPRMPGRFRAAVFLIALGVLLAAPAGAAPQRRYYLSLGDSLAVGMQPDAAGHDVETDEGYADVLARRLTGSAQNLTLEKVGCPGETTTSILLHNPCSYPAGSQLAQAESFLAAHRGSVSLITINIGDNDFEGCFHGPGRIDANCVAEGAADVLTNLPVIVGRLRAAAGRHVSIVGITDYDQFLAYWLKGTTGQRSARRSFRIVQRVNQMMDATYAATGVIVADAQPSFAETSLRGRTQIAGHGSVPTAVAEVCRLTWACSATPIGMNDHANAAGYSVIADVVDRALKRARVRL